MGMAETWTCRVEFQDSHVAKRIKKIVINDCTGGFGMSHQAMMRYSELSGIHLYPYNVIVNEKNKNGDLNRTYSSDDNLDVNKDVFYSKLPIDKPFEIRPFSCDDIARDDQYLVQVVEEMGDDANTFGAELRVVEIPSHVEWQLCNYDGYEWIAEKHRTWGGEHRTATNGRNNQS